MRFLPAIIVFGAAGAGYVYTQPDLVKSISPANWVANEGAAAAGRPADIERLASAAKNS